MLAIHGSARRVLGIDSDANVVRYASIRYPHPSVRFMVGDATRVDVDDSFDLIVSFETVEHVHDLEAYFCALGRYLRSDGTLVISTPVSSSSVDLSPGNPYHVAEWGFETFAGIVGEHFRIAKRFIQPSNISPLSRFQRLRTQGGTAITPHAIYDVLSLSSGQRAALGGAIGGYQIIVCHHQ